MESKKKKKKKKIQMNLLTKQKLIHRFKKTNLGLPKGKSGRRGPTGGLEPAHAHDCIWDGWSTGTSYRAEGTRPNILR